MRFGVWLAIGMLVAGCDNGDNKGSTSSGGGGGNGGGGGAGGAGGAAVAKAVWAKRFGEEGAMQPTTVAVSPAGQVILAGTSSGVIEFGGGVATQFMGPWAYLAALDKNGDYQWSRVFPVSNFEDISAGVDASGNVLIAVQQYDEIDLGGGALPMVPNCFTVLAKYDASGNHIWSGRVVSPEGADLSSSPHLWAVDDDGSAIGFGTIGTEITLNGVTLPSPGPSPSEKIVKIDPDGKPVWTRVVGPTGTLDKMALSVKKGNLIVAATTKDTMELCGDGMPVSAGKLFVCGLDADGGLVFSTSHDGQNAHVTRIAQTSSGKAVLAGTFYGTMDLGTGPATANGSYGIFIAPIDGSGKLQWLRTWDPITELELTDLSPSDDGSLLFIGWDHNTTDFSTDGTGVAGEVSGQKPYVVALDAQGGYRYTLRFQQEQFGDAPVVGIERAEPGNIVLTGSLRDPITLGDITLTPISGEDVFAAKLTLPEP